MAGQRHRSLSSWQVVRGVTVCVLLLALAGTAPSAAGQAGQQDEAGQQPPTFRAGVGLVRLDVTVTDGRGRPIVDLTSADFEVIEDGVRQDVQFLALHQLTGDVPPGDDRSLEIRSPEHAAQEAAREDVRLLVVFVDDYHLAYGALNDNRLKRTLLDFIESEIRPTDLVAVMNPLTPLSDLGLTRDLQVLRERIESVEGRLGGFVPPRSELEENQMRFGAAQLARIRAQVTLSALEALVVHLGGLREGRKSVLFVSQGPPIQFGNLFDDLQEVIAAANRANVTIHVLDPRELIESPMRSGTVNESLALETGGRLLARSNDYSTGLRAVMSDASSYYLLGYTPARDVADGKFHEVKVRVKRKGARVIARKGYWAPTEKEMTAAPEPSLPPDIAAALDRLAELSREDAIADWIGIGPVSDGRSQVSFAYQAADGIAAAAARVTVSTQSAGRDEMKYEAARPSERPLWLARFEAPPGELEIRVIVEDAAGEALERWSRSVRIPAVDDVEARMGTPIVTRAATYAEYRALESAGEVVPVPSRRFRRTDRVVVHVPIAGAADAELVAEVVNARGERLVALPVTRGQGGRTSRVELPLRNLAQASYLLRLTASFPGGSASQVVPFAIVP